MTSKNPYEIRSDILELAKEYMDKQSELNSEYAKKLMEAGNVGRQEYLEAFKPYSFEDLMAKATEMYSFVCSETVKGK